MLRCSHSCCYCCWSGGFTHKILGRPQPQPDSAGRAGWASFCSSAVRSGAGPGAPGAPGGPGGQRAASVGGGWLQAGCVGQAAASESVGVTVGVTVGRPEPEAAWQPEGRHWRNRLAREDTGAERAALRRRRQQHDSDSPADVRRAQRGLAASLRAGGEGEGGGGSGSGEEEGGALARRRLPARLEAQSFEPAGPLAPAALAEPAADYGPAWLCCAGRAGLRGPGRSAWARPGRTGPVRRRKRLGTCGGRGRAARRAPEACRGAAARGLPRTAQLAARPWHGLAWSAMAWSGQGKRKKA
jgi:hypothetical protein